MDDLLMGIRDAQRLGPLKAAVEGRITNRKGAELTGLSLRQFKRLKARVRSAGPRGLLHGNRGRASPRRLAVEIRGQVVTLLQHPEARLNDCHIRDLLAERGTRISAESVRQLRRQLGLAPKRRRRPPRHHRRRLRAARHGSLVLIDGSAFPWLGPHHPPFTLVGTLDDATSDPLSLVRRPHEDLHGFTQALRELITVHGLPEALYGDRTGIAVRNDPHWSLEEELAGRRRSTQFGQMLEELGVQYIPAHSPEAKGRIERLWQTLQDRLPAELALHRIRTLQQFDQFLPHFLGRCRAWFRRAPRDTVPAWRVAPPQLDRILACRYSRVVGRDNVVSIPGHVLQIPPGPHQRSYHRSRVEVRELLDGRLLVLHQGGVLVEQPAPPGPFILVPRDSATPPRQPRRQGRLPRPLRIGDRAPARISSQAPQAPPRSVPPVPRPPSNHPWRRSYQSNLLPSKAGARG